MNIAFINGFVFVKLEVMDKVDKKKPTQLLGENGYKYRQQYGVIVICDGEVQQQQVYQQLQAEGYQKLKVVSV